MAKNVLIWIGIVLGLVFILSQEMSFEPEQENISYSDFLTSVRNGKLSQVTIDGYTISGQYQNGQGFETVRPAAQDPKLIDDLYNNKVEIVGKLPEQPSLWRQLLVASFPIILMVTIFMLVMRQMQGGMGGGRSGGPMSFGRSKAKLLRSDEVKVTFADVAGVDEAKEEVSELVEFLKEPAKFKNLGGKIPKGVLMSGLPGTGKTLLAKAIAGEADVPFFSISGSDFVEMFVGVGASRVRDMFTQARKQSPCIIFIDEIDAVGRHRGAGMGGGHDEREQTLNQLLVEMDGFDGHEGVIVIAATNRPDVLDPALLRPGRFDRQVVVGLPDIRGRTEILQVHTRKVPIDKNVNVEVIARATPGFSGADLANLVNEAALFSAKKGRRKVSMAEFEQAKDKILMGAERRSMVMSDEEKRNTAYHESGHAIVGRLVPEHDPVYKVTIIPRGRALGVTMFLPEKDKYSHSKRAIESQIASLFGGRVAEELTLGSDGITTGASNDIERATSLARNMVTKWGLSEAIGPLHFGEENENPFLGYSAAKQQSPIASDTANKIDAEVKRIIQQSHVRAKKILVDNRDILELMSDALMEYETLESKQIDDIMKRIKPKPIDEYKDDDSGSASSTVNKQKKPKAMKTDDYKGTGDPSVA